MPQTIQFNMLADDQVNLLVEIANQWVDKIQALVSASGKMQYKQSIAYPNIGFIDHEKTIVNINIQYRFDGIYSGERVNVMYQN